MFAFLHYYARQQEIDVKFVRTLLTCKYLHGPSAETLQICGAGVSLCYRYHQGHDCDHDYDLCLDFYHFHYRYHFYHFHVYQNCYGQYKQPDNEGQHIIEGWAIIGTCKRHVNVTSSYVET